MRTMGPQHNTKRAVGDVPLHIMLGRVPYSELFALLVEYSEGVQFEPVKEAHPRQHLHRIAETQQTLQ